jgi:hypothetical protein
MTIHEYVFTLLVVDTIVLIAFIGILTFLIYRIFQVLEKVALALQRIGHLAESSNTGYAACSEDIQRALGELTVVLLQHNGGKTYENRSYTRNFRSDSN